MMSFAQGKAALQAVRAILILFLFLCVTSQSGADCGSRDEVHGMWVDSWNNGFKTAEQARNLVAFADRYGFTDLFVQVRKRGDAYYVSSTEPRAHDVSEKYDPLAYLLTKAHAKGIRVHAWVMLYDVWVEGKFVPKLPDSHVYARHPEWIMQDIDGKKTYVNGRMYLDPGIPDVARYQTGVVVELVQKYAIDGIHLDGLRYPDSKWGYNPLSVANFNAQLHKEGVPTPDDPDWCKWRREQMTAHTKGLVDAIRRTRKPVKISISAYWNRDEAYNRFFQDWPAWVKDGCFDFVVPMVFVPKTVKDFVQMVSEELECANGTPMCIGQGAWRYPSATTNRHLRVIRGKGAQGFVLFDYTALRAMDKKGVHLAGKLRIRL